MKPAFIALLALCLCLGGCGKKAAQIPQKKAKATQKAKPKVEAKKPEQPKAVPTKLITNPIVEEAIRKELKKLEGELTEADLDKVRELILSDNQLTDVTELKKLTQLKRLWLPDELTEVPRGLERLTQLKELYLDHNPDLTKAQIDELKKALPKCKIYSNPTK